MSWQCTLVNTVLRLMKIRLAGKSFYEAKAIMGRQMDSGGSSLPDDVRCEPKQLANVNCEWVYVDEQAESERVLMYFHGGGFFSGSPATHRDAAWRLSRAAGMKVLLLDYRLTPAYVYPAPLVDAEAVFNNLLEQGFRAQDIALAGDSAGGNMVIAVLSRLRDAGMDLPFAGVGISPWLDLTHSGDSVMRNRRRDPMVPVSLLANAAPVYADGASLDDPGISPLYVDASGFPPLYLLAGESEILVDDVIRFAARAATTDVKIKTEVWPRVPHAFTSLAMFLPEGREAIANIGEFLRLSHAAPAGASVA